HISETVYYAAIEESMIMATKQGAFPGFEESRYAKGDLQVQLAAKVQKHSAKTLGATGLPFVK
ncbi:MAG: hypothetical protein V4440_06530, partial [Pseudomonadota bacterium]